MAWFFVWLLSKSADFFFTDTGSDGYIHVQGYYLFSVKVLVL